MLLILSIAISFHMLALSVLQWTIALSPPPPTDAPNAGDPATGPLCIGDFIIENVDRVLVELSDHVIVFYNELITLMKLHVNSSGRRGMTRSRMC